MSDDTSMRVQQQVFSLLTLARAVEKGELSREAFDEFLKELIEDRRLAHQLQRQDLSETIYTVLLGVCTGTCINYRGLLEKPEEAIVEELSQDFLHGITTNSSVPETLANVVDELSKNPPAADVAFFADILVTSKAFFTEAELRTFLFNLCHAILRMKEAVGALRGETVDAILCRDGLFLAQRSC